MPTKFSVIYDRAVFKFMDYTFIDAVTDYKKGVLRRFLMSAIVDFQYVCKVDITKYDLEQEQFDNELDSEIIEILALGVAFHWLSAQALNRELLKNRIYNKDYTSYSPANLLKEVQTLRETIESEYRGKINEYSFRHGSIETLRV